MANIVLSHGPDLSGPMTPGFLRRGADGVRFFCANLAGEVAAERRDHRIRRDLGRVQHHLLRDLGIDRSAC